MSHIAGSQAALLCRIGTLKRSRSLKVKNAIRNQDIRVRTVANDAGAYHNAIVRMAERLFRVSIIGRVRKLPIRGYDRQTEEYFEGGDDRLFNNSLDELRASMSASAEAPDNDDFKRMREAAYARYMTAAEIRYIRLRDRGRLQANFPWESKAKAHVAGFGAQLRYQSLTAEEVAEVIEQETVAPSVPEAEVNQLIEDGVVPQFEYDDEAKQDGQRLLEEEAAQREREAAAHAKYVAERKASKLITPDSDEWNI